MPGFGEARMRAPALVLNVALAAAVPFLFLGAVGRVKALWAGRRGAPLLQPLLDFLKELRKGAVVSRSTSPLFVAAPLVTLASTLVAALLVPSFNHRALVSFPGDFVLFAYLLGLGRFASLIGAMDTGSSFEGMGASREIFFSGLAEPGFFMIAASLAYAGGLSSFQALLEGIQRGTPSAYLQEALAASGLFIMLLVEGSRVPVDDPATHLELTMVHEVMILDNSGPDLAFIQWASALKVYLFASLIAGVILPLSLSPALSLLMFLALLAGQAIAVGLLESWMARLRLTHVPQFIFLINVAGILLFFLALLGARG